MQDLDVVDHDLDGSEMEGSLLKAVRSKCVIQLLLLGALDSLQVRTLLSQLHIVSFYCLIHGSSVPYFEISLISL